MTNAMHRTPGFIVTSRSAPAEAVSSVMFRVDRTRG